MTVHVFGAVSSPSCANFALQKTATENIHSYGETVIDAVGRNFYVDDFCESTRRELLQCGGFRLTKWVSNSREVLSSIPNEELAKDMKINQDVLTQDRTLGVLWNLKRDAFIFANKVKDRDLTHRGILSIISSIYHPLGMVCDAFMPATLLIHDLCRKKLSWDEKIPTEHLRKWNKWLLDLPN